MMGYDVDKVVPYPPEIGSWEGGYASSPENFAIFALKW